MFIIKTELKLYLCKSIIACSAVIVVLAVAVGFAGEFLSKEKIITPFTMYIADNDNSFESNLLIKSLTEFKPDLMRIVQSDDELAKKAAYSNECAASLIIPNSFFADIMAGKKTSASLYINDNNPVTAELIELFSNSIKEQLYAGQTGVYAILSYADDSVYTQYMNEANIVYLSVFMSRAMESETGAAAGNERYYAFSLYVFIMFLLPGLIIQKGTVIKEVTPILQTKGIKFVAVYRFFSVLCLFAVINVLVIAALTIATGITFSAALIALLVLCQSAFCFLCLALFNDAKTAGPVIFISQLVATFFSGGIVPLVFLPEAIKRVSVFLPNYYLLNAYVTKTAGLSAAIAVVGLLALSFAAWQLVGQGRKPLI